MGDRINGKRKRLEGMTINFPNFLFCQNWSYFLMPQVIHLNINITQQLFGGIAAIKNVLKCTRDDNSLKEIRKTCPIKFSFTVLDAFNIS